ncbi:MAG: hypothetical protein K0R28_6873 [Paenibacillus sp.]|nr:hypothetical protein [Paenibacillus sp.]
MRKKWSLALLAGVFGAAMLTGCSGGAEPTMQNDSGSKKVETPQVRHLRFDRVRFQRIFRDIWIFRIFRIFGNIGIHGIFGNIGFIRFIHRQIYR